MNNEYQVIACYQVIPKTQKYMEVRRVDSVPSMPEIVRATNHNESTPNQILERCFNDETSEKQ